MLYLGPHAEGFLVTFHPRFSLYVAESAGRWFESMAVRGNCFHHPFIG